MEATSRHSDLSDTEDETSLDSYSYRLNSASTDTDDTNDGSDEDSRVTRLETDKAKNVFPGTPQRYKKVSPRRSKTPSGTVQNGTKASPGPAPSDTKASLGPNPSETSVSPGVPHRGTNDTQVAGAHSPEEDNELFSADYVDKLVASFWSKVDQKIETAVSQHQPSPQAGQQTNSQDSAQTTTEDKKNDDKCPLSKPTGGVCIFIIFIFQFIGKIFGLCKDKLQSKGREWFSDGKWREDIRPLITHRHANFTVVMVTVFDCFLVIANILVDFDVIDDNGIEFIFVGFLYINLVIMFLFLFECLLRVFVLRRDLFKDKMEIFDVALITFYFVVESFSSHGFSDVGEPYPKYLHMIVSLRLWRILLVVEQVQQEKEDLSAMESQAPKE